MVEFIASLFPVLVIVIGAWLMAHRAFVAPAMWAGIEKLVYFLFFRALIVDTLAHARFDAIPWRLVATVLGAQLLFGRLGLLVRRDGSKGSIIQSNVRWNTIVALPIISSLYGEQGIALLAIVATALTPTAHLMSVTAMLDYAHRPGRKAGAAAVSPLTDAERMTAS